MTYMQYFPFSLCIYFIYTIHTNCNNCSYETKGGFDDHVGVNAILTVRFRITKDHSDPRAVKKHFHFRKCVAMLTPSITESAQKFCSSLQMNLLEFYSNVYMCGYNTALHILNVLDRNFIT